MGGVTEVLDKTNLAQTAFGTVMGAGLGAKFVAICLFFFAFSTVLGWNLFGKINVIYLFGKKSPKLCTTIYTVVALIFIFLGTTMSNDLGWELTDMFNNLMVIPNAIALFALTSVVVRVARREDPDSTPCAGEPAAAKIQELLSSAQLICGKSRNGDPPLDRRRVSAVLWMWII